MIEMWDEQFTSLIDDLTEKDINEHSLRSFSKMHRYLAEVWAECYRVLKPGSYLCINIGDATRTLNNGFRLYPNHSQIITECLNLGFNTLPVLLWRKQTNVPNKFMGSGMLPGGAYVTLEHEYILIFRKGQKKQFSESEKVNRRRSAYFWEERNRWFSDLWDFKGATQKLKQKNGSRLRSAAFPEELSQRLILMYSSYTDTVLDPFAGTGTTTASAIATGRNSIALDIEDSILSADNILTHIKINNLKSLGSTRLIRHQNFIADRTAKGLAIKHYNEKINLPVITSQEKEIELFDIKDIFVTSASQLTVDYTPAVQKSEVVELSL